MVDIQTEIKQSKFQSEFSKLMINIIFTGNWLSASHARGMKKYGISTSQYNILRILRGQYPNPATINIISERMLDRMSNTSRLVEKLREKGYLERKTCSSDRRAVDILITEKGKQLLTTLDPLMTSLEEPLRNLSAEEAYQLNDLLDKIRE